jgi:hypothetical protein
VGGQGQEGLLEGGSVDLEVAEVDAVGDEGADGGVSVTAGEDDVAGVGLGLGVTETVPGRASNCCSGAVVRRRIRRSWTCSVI